MAVSNNPFYVSPPNILEALAYGQQGYDRARKAVKEEDLKAGRQRALERMNAGDTQGALAETLGMGDTDGAKALAQYADNQANRAFRESEAVRAQSNADRAFQLQQGSQALQRQQIQATLDGQKVPSGYRRSDDGNLQAIPGGPADPNRKPDDPFDNEQKLRKEFEGVAKPFKEVREGYRRILSSKDDAAGDISLAFGFMKMLDPGSVVREGEYATVGNAAGIPEQVRNAYNRALSGERLSLNQRNMFKGQAGALFKTAETDYKAREGQYRGIAQQYKLEPGRILPAFDDINAGLPSSDAGAGLPPPPAGFQVIR